MAHADVLKIMSTRDPDREGVCELTWGPLQWYAPVDDVRATAADMMACAAYAEWMHLLLTEMGLPAATVERATMALFQASGRTRNHGLDTTITLVPASGKPPGGGREARVVIIRGGIDGMLTVAETREMAMHWFAVAEATDQDQLMAEAFSAVMPGHDAAAERMFGYARKLREQRSAG